MSSRKKNKSPDNKPMKSPKNSRKKHVSRSYPINKRKSKRSTGFYVRTSRRKNRNTTSNDKKYKEVTMRRSRKVVAISDSNNKALSYIRKL